MILMTVNIPGGLHAATAVLNECDVADFVVAMNPTGNEKRIVVVTLRVPHIFIHTVEEALNYLQEWDEEDIEDYHAYPGQDADWLNAIASEDISFPIPISEDPDIAEVTAAPMTAEAMRDETNGDEHE